MINIKILVINYYSKEMNKNKKILIKTDGNNVIGMGHIYRCISLVKELKKRYYLLEN